MSRPALLTGFAVLTAAAVLVVVNGLSSGTTAATAPAALAAAALSSIPTSTSTSTSVMVAPPVVSILRMTATVTITATTTATATATATTTTRISAAPTVTPTTPPRSQPPMSKTIRVPKGGPATTPPVSGAPTRLSVLAGGSAVPGVVTVTVSATAGTRSASSAPFIVKVPS